MMPKVTANSPELGRHRRRAFAARARWLAFLISGCALFLLARRTDSHLILSTLRSTTVLPWLTAAMLCGVSLSLAAWRWNSMLRISGVHPRYLDSWRFSIVGHAFSSLLLGAALSDIAKGSLYSRRFGFPASQILAASALDRLAGTLSTIIYGGLALMLAWMSVRPLASELQVSWKVWSLLAILGLVLVTIAALGAIRRFWRQHWDRFFLRFAAATRELLARPWVAVKALAIGLLMQVCVSGILAACLMSVHRPSVDWFEMAWTFPAIGVAASLPVTLSGAGAREGAAVLLWRPFGIAPETAFSAALLVFGVNILWAGIGLVLMWREGGSMPDQPTD
ncbi:MAG: flippase-like domain-containing protein [Verrucomicrobia bacterium]|nr:flippase-like domain-containing protein [Verrucomicrobiota bacterium]